MTVKCVVTNCALIVLPNRFPNSEYMVCRVILRNMLDLLAYNKMNGSEPS